jgi:uncharacterized protein (DUF1499 family)
MYLLILPVTSALGFAATLKLRNPGVPLRDGLYMWMAGDPYLGDVEFARYRHAQTRNEAMICSPGGCPRPDVLVAEVPVTQTMEAVAHDLESVVINAVGASGQTIEMRSMKVTPSGVVMNFIARTRLMRFPDTLNIALRTRPKRRNADIAILSRSQLGKGDGGANRARLERIAAALAVFTRRQPLGSK